MQQPDGRGHSPTRARRRAWDLIRGKARPNGSGLEPVHLPEPDERQAYRVLNFSLLSGEVLLAAGAGASDVTASVMAAANACGLSRVDVDVTFTSIVVSYVRTAEVAPVTAMRIVRYRSPDHTRVTQVHNLVSDLTVGKITPEDAFVQLDQIRHAPHPYSRWASTGMLLGMAASVVAFMGGGPATCAAGAAIAVVVDRSGHWMTRRNVPLFFQHAFGAGFATAAAAGLSALGAAVSTSLVIAGGIILLLPGVALVGAVHDAITGYLVTASARAMEVLLLTSGIIAGVGVALSGAAAAGVSIPVAEPAVALWEIPVQVVAAGSASAFFALSLYAPRRLAAPAGLTGAAGWAVFLLLTRSGIGPSLATFAAATVVGAAAFLLASRRKAPPLVLVASGTVPLLPGLTIYQGMFALNEGTPSAGFVLLVQALAIGLALSSGAILGQFLIQPARRNIARFERRISGPRLAGPLHWRAEKDEPPSPAEPT